MKLNNTTLALMLASAGLLTLPSYAQVTPAALPTGGVVNAGTAAIVQNGSAMQVNQSSNKAVIDWQTFNIGRDASVRFNQPSVSAITLNRVAANTGRSVIDGALSANGQVWLLNPDGVMFSNTARVDAGGLLATTMNLGNTDFMGGNFRLGKDGAGSIVNQGLLKAADGGYIALLAPEVRNEGVITARLGTVALATGDELRLDFSGDRLIEVKVDKATVDGLIDNKNLVEAEGGWVLMSTDAANRLSQGAINNTGIVRATTVQEHEGVIKLLGGVTTVAGTLDASAPNGGNGGFIETSGHTVHIDPSVSITTKAEQGKSGSWLIDPNDYTIAASGGNITGATLSTQLANNGVVTIATATMGTSGGNGDIFVNDDITWSSGNKLQMFAERNININANIQGNGTITLMAGTQNNTTVVNDNGLLTIAAAKTVSSTLAASYYQATNSFCFNTAAVCLIGGRMDLQGNVSAVNQLAIVGTYNNRSITLGVDDVNAIAASGGTMGLTQAEIGRVSAKYLMFSNSAIGTGTANVNVDSPINFPNVTSLVGIGTVGSLVLNSTLSTTNLGILLGGSTGGVSQTTSGLLSVTNLQIAGGSTGTVALNTAQNNVSNLVAKFNGALNLNNASNNLTVNSQISLLDGTTINGLSTTGNITLQTSGNLTTTITGNIRTSGTLIDLSAANMTFGADVGASNSGGLIRLTATGDITGPTFATAVSGTGTGNNAVIRAGGNVDLSKGSFQIGTLAAQLTGSGKFIHYRPNGNSTVGTVDGLSGITTNNGNVTIDMEAGELTVANNINAGTGRINLLAWRVDNQGITINSGATVTSTLATPNTTSPECISTFAVCIATGRLNIVGNISAANQDINIAAGLKDTGRDVLVGADDVNAATASGGALGLTAAELNQINAKRLALSNVGSSSNTYNTTVSGAVNITGIQDVVLYADKNIAINASVTLPGIFYLRTGSLGTITQNASGTINAAGLGVLGGTSAVLNVATSNVGFVTATVAGDFKFLNGSNPLFISAASFANGVASSGVVSTNNGVVDIRTSGDLTISNNVNAGAGIIDIKSTGENRLLTIASGATVSSTYAGQTTASGATVSSTYAGQTTAVSSGNCGVNLAVCLYSGRMNINGSVSAVNQAVSFTTGSDRLIQLGLDDIDGPNNSTGALGLTNAELNRVTAKQLAVANSYGGNKSITVADAINVTGANDLLFFTNNNVNINTPLTVKGNILVQMETNAGQPNGNLTQSSVGILTATGLVVKGLSVRLTSAENAVGNIAANVSESYHFKNNATSLTVGSLPWWDQTSVSGIKAFRINIKTGGDLILNSALTANGVSDISYSPGTVQTDSLCSGTSAGTSGSVCKLPHVDLTTAKGFTNNVGASAIVFPIAAGSSNPRYWTLKALQPSTTKLNGLVPGAETFDASSYTGHVLVSANRVFYYQKDPVTTTPTQTVVETSVVSETSQAGTAAQSSIAINITPDAGLGNGGATMENFPTQGNTNAQKGDATAATSTNKDNAEPSPPPKLIVEASKSVPKLAGVLNRAELDEMSQQVRKAREKLFEGALAELEKNPQAADLAECGKGGGKLCIAKPLVTVKADGYLPIVKRKVALLIGNNTYRSPIPSLETAVNDVTAIASELKDNLGYEVKVVQDAGQQDIVNALNDLIRNTEKDDSVMVMYAGHGYLQEKNNTGYWIPSDAATTSPEKWISNDTIARALSNIPAKQVMLVSDSCYSGTLTKEGKVIETVAVSREKTLTRRSVLALSSGADEPVSDEGRDNHSIFAWNMIQMLKQMKTETSGQQMHANLKDAVVKEYPQTPQYGTVLSAGHAEGGEYLFTPATGGVR